MPNTKPYNKEEVMKEFYTTFAGNNFQASYVRVKEVDGNIAPYCMDDFLNEALTAAEQAGEERMREKVLKLKKEGYLCSCKFCNYNDAIDDVLEALK